MKTDENISNNLQSENGSALNNEKYVRSVKKIAREEGVAKGAWVTALISFLILAAACVIFYSIYKSEQKKQNALMEDQKVTYTGLLNARDSTINDWVLTFDQIEKDIQTIKDKEKIITLKSSDREFTKERKQQILEDIKYINSLLDQNKKKIAVLSEQLRKSGGTIKSLQIKITELEASMKQSETEISDLKVALSERNFKIDQLNARVSDMQLEIAQKEETISNQINEMNKAYIASGTYKDLKAKGLISKEGGFLGLGKKKSLIENFPDSSFTLIDVTKTKSITLNSKKAKLISEHPLGSYEFVRDNNDNIASIKITDPDKFWKISKYAVVEVVR